MINLSNIQTKIAEAIKTCGLTQTALAEKLNIKQQSVAQYLSGRAMPALDTFANLCVVLDLDANEILGIEEAQRHNNKAVSISNSFNNVEGSINFKS